MILRVLSFSFLIIFLLASSAEGATITVNTTEDENNTDGDCSLREAVIASNTDQIVDGCTPGSGNDTIQLPSGTIVLNLTGVNEDQAATGDSISEMS